MVSDESGLIQQALAGSADAFCELVQLHQRAVRTYLGRTVRDAETADDLAQDAFIEAYRALKNFRGESTLRTWVIGIARVMALRHLQEEARRAARESKGLPVLLASWRAERTESPLSEPRGHERKLEALSECLKSLPEESATLVAQHYFNRKSSAEIARAAGRKEGSVRMILLRIREELRRCVERRLIAPGAKV